MIYIFLAYKTSRITRQEPNNSPSLFIDSFRKRSRGVLVSGFASGLFVSIWFGDGLESFSICLSTTFLTVNGIFLWKKNRLDESL